MEKEITLSDNRVLKIIHDQSPESPRTWDNLGIMAAFHRRYDLGDDNIPFDPNQFSGWADMREHIETVLDAVVILPLYLYDHSGITMATTPFSCSFDSGQVGYIYVTRKTVEKEYGRVDEETIATATRVLEGEVETFDTFIRGDIYGFKLVKKTVCDLGHEHEEEIDSCWGFYGSNPKENGMLDHIRLSEEDEKALDAL